jgi:hypothetical protein
MARARLYLICGNCGCNDEWKWEYEPRDKFIVDEDDFQEEDVWLVCENCSTLHSINDNAKHKDA